MPTHPHAPMPNDSPAADNNPSADDRRAHESLDPEDWQRMRALAHRMVDDALTYLQTVAQRPVWQPVPPAVQTQLQGKLPHEPSAPEKVYDEFVENILPYPLGNIHPRFWAWYMGNGTVFGALADLLAATMNPNHGGGQHAANLVELQVVGWMKEITGFPDTASGLLVSGGSMANLVGIAVARNSCAGFDVRRYGVADSAQKLLVYASSETHSCNQKAVELLGLGNENLRKIDLNDDYSMHLQHLADTIAADQQAGHRPICVVATAGTVNTGAIDDLNAIADLCQQHKIWFHVDGAIGAVALLADNVRAKLCGLERADSVAMDLHKWLHIPFEAACVLVRDRELHRQTFSLMPEYLQKNTRGIASGGHWFSEYGVQLSRSFRALKIWMTIKEHGSKKLGRMIARNVAQAQYLGRLIAQHPKLELRAPIGLNIVCFRFNPGNVSAAALGKLNRAILENLQEQGLAAPSDTTLRGEYCLRVAICNHRSRDEDFDLLVRETIRIGDSLAA